MHKILCAAVGRTGLGSNNGSNKVVLIENIFYKKGQFTPI